MSRPSRPDTSTTQRSPRRHDRVRIDGAGAGRSGWTGCARPLVRARTSRDRRRPVGTRAFRTTAPGRRRRPRSSRPAPEIRSTHDDGRGPWGPRPSRCRSRLSRCRSLCWSGGCHAVSPACMSTDSSFNLASWARAWCPQKRSSPPEGSTARTFAAAPQRSQRSEAVSSGRVRVPGIVISLRRGAGRGSGPASSGRATVASPLCQTRPATARVHAPLCRPSRTAHRWCGTVRCGVPARTTRSGVDLERRAVRAPEPRAWTQAAGETDRCRGPRRGRVSAGGAAARTSLGATSGGAEGRRQ